GVQLSATGAGPRLDRIGTISGPRLEIDLDAAPAKGAVQEEMNRFACHGRRFYNAQGHRRAVPRPSCGADSAGREGAVGNRAESSAHFERPATSICSTRGASRPPSERSGGRLKM